MLTVLSPGQWHLARCSGVAAELCGVDEELPAPLRRLGLVDQLAPAVGRGSLGQAGVSGVEDVVAHP
ncbi:hypothetical protein [Salinactinospora qingdaonensis]|uniref:hypothetical protein n=1 Tax=Salinactinospora qingdaonensis TaxID=702744 RepID=UPI0031ECA13F